MALLPSPRSFRISTESPAKGKHSSSKVANPVKLDVCEAQYCSTSTFIMDLLLLLFFFKSNYPLSCSSESLEHCQLLGCRSNLFPSANWAHCSLFRRPVHCPSPEGLRALHWILTCSYQTPHGSIILILNRRKQITPAKSAIHRDCEL